MMKLRIVRVDMDGYNGREFHPSPSDEGLVVLPLKLETWNFDESGTSGDMQLEPSSRVSAQYFHSENLYQVWTAVTEDGRTLELMSHEVELVEAR